MNPRGLPRSLEQIWSDEVRYLHSLWHHGPPQNPNPNPKPKPNNLLRPSSCTTFKKEIEKKKIKKKKKNNKNNNNSEDSNSRRVSDVAWPCNPEPEPRNDTGWPEPDPQSVLTNRPASAEEQAKFAALQLQQKGLKASQDFFSSNIGSDNEGEENEEEDEEDNWMESDGDESEEFKFFLGIFTEDSELRGYYEKNCEGGEFCCFVCSAIGKKAGKRFKNCVALVQHSTAIYKTKRKRAHRAFGQAICRVLGWDIKRLPSIVLSISEPLGRILAQAETKVDLEECGGTSGNVVDSVNADNAGGDRKEDLQNQVVESVDSDNDESMDFQVQMGSKESEKKKNKRGKKKKKKDSNEDSDLPQVSGVAWPCKPELEPRKDTGWPELDSQSGPTTRPASTEEQAKVATFQLQRKALKASQDFFSSKIGSDNEGEENEEDDDEEKDWMESDGDESEEFKFFLGIFTEDSKLRDYYEKNCKGGEFCCLVCGGIGKKASKRFKNCVALVQHSRAISKTKRKRAHRAFGQAICRILSWDIKRLPNIILSISEPPVCILAQAEAKVGLEECGGTSDNVADSVNADSGDGGGGDQKEDLHNEVVELSDSDNDGT